MFDKKSKVLKTDLPLDKMIEVIEDMFTSFRIEDAYLVPNSISRIILGIILMHLVSVCQIYPGWIGNSTSFL